MFGGCFMKSKQKSLSPTSQRKMRTRHTVSKTHKGYPRSPITYVELSALGIKPEKDEKNQLKRNEKKI